MSKFRRFASGLGAVAIAAPIVLAGCGSSHSTSSPPSSLSNGGGSQAKGTPIKIGYIENAVSLGAGSTNPYTIPAFKAWVSWTDAHGGLDGHPVQLLTEREADNPGIAFTDVQKMVHQGIVALLSDDTQDEDAWAKFVEQAGVPVFETTSGSVTLAVNPIEFSTQTSLLYNPQAIVAAAAKAGSSNMAVLYCAEIPQCKEAVPALAGAGKAAGVTVPFSTSILGSAPNYTAQCLAAKDHGATSLEIADASQIIVRVAASCAQQAYTPHEITSGLNLQLSFAGEAGMNGLIAFDSTAPFFDTSLPAIGTMTEAFNEYDPGLTKLAGYGDLATSQWATGVLIAEAAKAGGLGTTSPIAPASMLAGIYALHSTNLDGLVPTLTFVPNKPHENACWFWAEIENGNYTLPFGLTPSCAT